MSSVSQTPRRGALGFGPYFAIVMVVVALIVVFSVGPAGAYIVRAAGQGRLHAPDLSLLADLSTPVRIHLLTALAALGLGAALMLARKGRTFHRLAGWTWVSLVAATAVSTLFITSLGGDGWSLLHLLTGWTLIVLPLGVVWARRRDIARHRRTMMGLFYGGFAINLFVAFIPGRTMWNMFFG